ncbi:iron chelate uptake ABC transporter family permease subunit [Candidatus Sodalis pierantonius]|uniref:iron chelate uptake ABC transporter family permease subunit n=1 Tax=Candidatus Sodalis pierantonii TaxID=1486991 RepID=UPI003AA8C745
MLKRQQRYDRRRLVLLGLLLLAALIFSLSAGEIWLWPTRWLSDDARLFIWQLRLPRTLAVVLVGASLGMAGAVMQGIFDNPLAEPGLLGAGMTLTLAVLLGGGRLPVWVLGLSAVAGGGMLLLADVVARVSLRAADIPVGVVTAALGAPVFIWLLIRVRG